MKSREEVFYGVLDSTPVGPVLVAMTENGIVALDMGIPERTFVSRLERQKGGRHVIHSQERTQRALRQLVEYFTGSRASFDLRLDLRGLTEFQREVLLRVSEIPRGRIATYGEISLLLGKPRAARAVGQALARNPVPIIIPCHRVVASDGSLSGYSGAGGIKTKETLLSLEGARPK